MQAPIEVSRRGVGEVFSLDILSHRMSAIAMLRQLLLVKGLPDKLTDKEMTVLPTVARLTLRGLRVRVLERGVGARLE